jgi:hypothetical protein
MIYLNNENLAQIRFLKKANTSTPLLIPSFSSVCDRKIGEIHANLVGHIPDCSLVSAYDLAHGYINQDNIWASNIVYVDSGNYEYHSLRKFKDRKVWSPSYHHRLLKTLKPLSNIVIVNFDKAGKLENQINNAQDLFSEFPDCIHCFLSKPFSSSSEYIDIDTTVSRISELKQFDIIAFTEKELGSSLIERATNIITIRNSLALKGLNIPIHIFGCLDPLAMITFFICGADIFDGTNWLKYTFYENLTIYFNDYNLLSGNWSASELIIRNESYVYNLSKLATLNQNMKQYTREVKIGVFSLNEKIQKQISDLVNTAKLRV